MPGRDGAPQPERFGSRLPRAAVLAGLGVRSIVDRTPRRVAVALCAVFAATTFVEGYRPVDPVPFAIPPSTRAAYEQLAERPPGAVVELPFNSSWASSRISREAYQVYGTLIHGHPIVTGYSGYFPPLFWVLQSHTLLHDVEPGILPALRALGVRYLLVHEDLYDDPQRARATIEAIVSRPNQLQSVEGIGTTTLVTLRPAAAAVRRRAPGRRVRCLCPAAACAPPRVGAAGVRRRRRTRTRWMSLGPQSGDEHVTVDFDEPTGRGRPPVRARCAELRALPRHLVVEGTVDGRTFHPLYDDSIVPQFLLGAVDSRRYVNIDVALPPRRVRALRLRQTGRDDRYYWSINELQLWALP